MDAAEDPMERFAGNQEKDSASPNSPRLPIPPQPGYMDDLERGRELLSLAKYGATHPGFVPQPVDVRALRRRMRMTRVQFARRIGFPVETVRHWERGDRKPRRAALVLLNLIERHSMLALRLLRKRPA